MKIYSKILIKNLKKQVFISIIGFVLPFILTSFHILDDTKKVKTVVIDAGHGGKDPGCNGVTFKEKDVSLAVALKLGKLIEENFKDVKVIYTRTTDVFVELEDRAQIANKNKADLFISIHCNAAGKPVMIKNKKTGKMQPKTFVNSKGKRVVVETTNPVPFGSETYVMGLKNEEGKMKVAQRENSVILMEDNYQQKYAGFDPESEESYIIMSNYTSAYLIQSASLALKIQDEYVKKAGRVNRGVHRQSIWVLWRTAMPSVLTEIGYLTNPLEEEFLGSEKGQTYIATSIFKGFRKYKDEVEGHKKEYNDEYENMPALENENLKAGNTGKPPKEEVVIEEESDTSENSNQPTPVKKNTEGDTGNVASNTNDIIKNYKEKSILKDTVKTTKINNEEIKNNSTEKEVIEFKVQFASSDTELDLNHEKFAVIENGWYYKSGDIFKYTSGKFKTSAEAFKHQKKLTDAGFKDCFVVAFKNGQRINLSEAKTILGKN